MKYLKVTACLFAVAFVFSAFNIQAAQTHREIALTNIKLPIGGSATSPIKGTKTMDETNNQTLYNKSCIDNISKDGRSVSGKLSGTLAGMPSTEWRVLPEKATFQFTNTSSFGSWNLTLKSTKSFLTTATMNGIWFIN